jgi:hypothetical protein
MTEERRPEGEPGSTTEPGEPGSTTEPGESGSTTEPIEPPPATPTWDAPASPAAPAPSWEAPAVPAPTPAPAPLAPLVSPTAPPPPLAQPAVAWGAPAPAVAAQGGRTMLAAIAGVVMLVLGVLGGILGLLVAVVGGTFISSLGDLAEIPEFEGADPGAVLGGVVAFFGIIVIVYSLLYVIAGIGVLRSRGWGRVMGIVVGIISGLIWLSGLSSSESSNLPFAIVMLAIHVYIVVVLAVFWRNKTATA